jgi:CheY-like chemotaxis protein
MTGDGNPGGDDRPVVLAVDDEPRVVQAFELWLGEDYHVLAATGGSEALTAIDESVDVVLLDRHMPGLSGDEVLERIRGAGYGCRVAMVTAVDPDFDIVDMPFDHYVTKPVDAPTLRGVIDRLLAVEEYDRQLNELYAVSQKVATLETEKHPEQLADSERYAALLDRQERLQADTDDIVSSLDGSEVEHLFGATDTPE